MEPESVLSASGLRAINTTPATAPFVRFVRIRNSLASPRQIDTKETDMNAPTMRAKMQVQEVRCYGSGEHACEELTFRAVCKSGAYGNDGLDENNTFARFTPQADMKMTINNPALLGKVKPDDEFYLDFILVEKNDPQS